MKIGMRRAGPNEVSPIRSLSYFAAMTAAMLVFQPGRWPSVTPLMMLAVFANVATSSVLGDQLYIYSINKIGASLAVSVNSAYPLVTTVVSILVLGEEITRLIWAGTVLIIIGLLLVTQGASRKMKEADPDRKGHLAAKTLLAGIALAAASAVCSGVNNPFIKVIMHEGGWSPLETYFLRSLAYIVIVWSVRLFEWRRFPHIVMPLRKVRLKSWLALLSGGFVALALGGVLFGICVNVLPVSVVTPITASSPLLTVMIARFFYKERLTVVQNAGVVFVILGSIAVSL
jgi:drug/metabolite transporter (DMT)-like permease